ncbi:hypothetical protein UO65_1790 [Actinokineospora spheciospongiae]|uniref:Uncharacterized protein n=1 Tax=Actinokineospora spheciospongiae TaxID=909613 RepID=W7JA18_9PSEU|nr:hypothetical protein UO65_1790 [Actinokineospora spheciospongiae]
MTPESVSRTTAGEQSATALLTAGPAPGEAAVTVTDAMADGPCGSPR